MQPQILITSGEPAGIGPDLCLLAFPELAAFCPPQKILFLGDVTLFRQRMRALGVKRTLCVYPQRSVDDALHLWHTPLMAPVQPGVLDARNADYVYRQLIQGITFAQHHRTALVTAPVHKAILNTQDHPFTGHTEFLQQRCRVSDVVMLLVAVAEPPQKPYELRVALATTHLPLKRVADAINETRLIIALRMLHHALQRDFGIGTPRILVSGLNPHAGENGLLGDEEQHHIIPAVHRLQQQGLAVSGPFPADTLFTPPMLEQSDAIFAMYHDQGLSVLKHYGFGRAVNITLGLPFVRTSVDHGTALERAASGDIHWSSLVHAVRYAQIMRHRRYPGYPK